jgi:putative flippase GtrA
LPEIDTAPAPSSALWASLVRWRLLRQFVKFCLVGVLSTTVDLSAFAFLRSQHVPRLAANTLAFLVAVTNGFIWNRRWTFRARDPGRLRRQYLSFFAVSIVGFLLNTAILQVVAELFAAGGMPTRHAEMLGKAAAIPLVAIWNFAASKVWAFAGIVPPEVEG